MLRSWKRLFISSLCLLSYSSTYVFAQPITDQKQWMRSKSSGRIYIPPPPRDRGTPTGDSTIGQERSLSSEGDYSLIALVPRLGNHLFPVVSGDLSLWFYLPAKCPISLPDCTLLFELIDLDTGSVTFIKALKTYQHPGLLKISVSPESPLKQKKRYRWRLRIIKENGKRSRIVVFGNIEPKVLSKEIKLAIHHASNHREQYLVWGKYGYWFNMLTGILNQKISEPNNKLTTQDLQSTLGQINIECQSLSQAIKANLTFIPMQCKDLQEDK